MDRLGACREGCRVILLLPACYQRVVHDKQGNYVGTIYEGNLPDDSRGFWTDAFETNRVVQQQDSDEVQRIRRENQALYDSQVKELDLGDLDTENP